MPGFLRQATASQSRALGPFISSTDFITAQTGLTIANTDIKLVVNGGASANKNSGGGTHRTNGVYGVTFDSTDSATVGEVEVSVVVAGALPVFDKFYVVEEAVFDALFAASAPGYLQPATAGRTLVVDAAGLADANVVKLGPTGAGTAQTARDIGTSVLLSSGTGTGQLDFTSGVVKANLAQILATALTETAGLLAGGFKKFFNVATPTGTVNSIPDAVAGAAGGLQIAGSNAATTYATLTVTGATTLTGNVALADGLTIAAPSTGNRAGLDITGNGTGAAVKLAAGATGKGIAITTTAGDGLSILPTAGSAIVATGNGTSKHGIVATGGSAGTSDGIKAAAGTGGVDLRAAITGDITGALSGAVGSVTGAVGSVTARVTANTDQLAGQTVTAAAGVTFPTSVASPTNITAGTITTATNVTTVNGLAAAVITATSIAADAITDAKVAADVTIASVTGAVGSVTGAVGSVTGNVGGNVTGSVGSVVGAVGSVTGNVGGNVVGSVGSVTAAVSLSAGESQVVQSGTAAAGGASTITIATAVGTTADLIGCKVKITSGTGANQERIITGYVNGTKVVTVNYAWVTTPDNTSVYTIVFDNAPKVDSSLKISGVVLTDTLTTYTGNTVQTGDAFARLGAPAGASVSADVAAVKVDTAAVKTKTDFLPSATAGSAGGVFIAGSNAATSITTALTANLIGNITGNLSGSVGSVTGLTASDVGAIKTQTDKLTFTVANQIDANVLDWKSATAPAMTGDAFARLGAPAGASVSADVAAVKAETAAIVADTNELQTDWADGGRLDLILDARASQSSVDTIDDYVDTEVAAIKAVTDKVSSMLVSVGSPGDYVFTAAALAQVWDAVLLQHLTAGSTGAALNAAGSAGDPWTTAVPGAYSAGQAGFILGTNLNATVSSRATQTSVDAVQTDVDDIQSRLPAALIGGRIDANVGAISSDSTAADNAEAFFDGTGYAGTNNVIPLVTTATNLTNAATAGDFTATMKTSIGTAVAASAVASVTGNVGGNVTGSVGSVATGGITAASIAADAIGASELAADAVAEISAAVWAESSRLLTAGTNIVLAKGVGVTGFNDLSAAQVNAEADTALSDVGLTTTVTGRIDAAVSTRATQASVDAVDDFVDTEVAAIKAVTDKLATTLESVGSPGQYVFTVDALAQGPSGTGSSPSAIADEVQTRTIAAVTLVNGLAANTVNAAALATDAVTEIQTGLATAAALSAAAGNITAIKAKTDNLPTDPADQSLIIAGTDALAALIGTPAVSLAADIAAVPTATENADALLNRDMGAGTDTNTRSPRNALRFVRNGFSIAGTTLTVLKEDDSTPAYTRDLTTDAAADPITGVS